jgi:hypothetical protein
MGFAMFKRSGFAMLVLVVVSLFGTAAADLALAGASQAHVKKFRRSVTIANNSGGRIIDFAKRSAQLRNSRALVRFAGRCDSACTLFLALPSHQTCISPGAYFRFHAPSAGSQRAARMAQVYMMRKYPGWVKGWIARNGGLSGRLVTMNYAYASRFLRSCSRVASR